MKIKGSTLSLFTMQTDNESYMKIDFYRNEAIPAVSVAICFWKENVAFP